MPLIDPNLSPHNEVEKNELSIVHSLISKFPAFAKQSLDTGAFKAPWWFLVIYISGISASMERIELKFMLTNNNALDGLASWPFAWGLALGGGLISAFIVYTVHGGIYHLFVKCAGGKKSFGVSANVFAYSRVPLFAFLLLTAVFNTVYYGESYWDGISEAAIDNIILVVVIGLNILAVVNSYRAIKILQPIGKVRGVIFLLVAPILLVGIAFSAYVYRGIFAAESFNEYTEKGLIAYNKNEYEEAIAHYDEAYKLTSPLFIEDRINILRNKYLAQNQLGQLHRAEATLDEALSLATPGSFTAHILAGSKAQLNNDIRKSLEKFGAALALEPDSFEVHNELGLIYLGDYDPAYLDYERALKHNEAAYRLLSSNVTLEVLALNLYYLEDYENAEIRYIELREALPLYADPWAYLGLIYYETGRYEEVIVQLKKAFELAPEYRTDYMLQIYEESLLEVD